jgi:hypothetical protein
MTLHRISLGDALRVLGDGRLTTEQQERAVGLLGFDLRAAQPVPPKPPEREPKRAEPAPEPEPRAVAPPPEPPPADELPNEAWVSEVRRPARSGGPEWYARVAPLAQDTEAAELPPPKAESLLPPEAQRGLLLAMLSQTVPGREIDEAALVKRLAAREVLAALPRRRRRSTRAGVQVLLDISETMEPFALDQDELVTSLRRLLPDERLAVSRCRGAPPDEPPRGRRAQAWHPPSAGTLVLLVSDLGQGGALYSSDDADPERWIGFARRLAVGGCAFVVLAPVSPGRIDPRLARRLDIIPWDRRAVATAMRRRHRAR